MSFTSGRGGRRRAPYAKSSAAIVKARAVHVTGPRHRRRAAIGSWAAMLPEPEERAALVTALTELIAEHGHSDFLFGPILTPSPEHFPDPWRPDGDGAAAMLRRLLS